MSEDMSEHMPLPDAEKTILDFLAAQKWPIANWPSDILKDRSVLERLIDRKYVKEHFPAGGCGIMQYSIKQAGLEAIGKGVVNSHPTLLARIRELEAERDAANARAERALKIARDVVLRYPDKNDPFSQGSAQAAAYIADQIEALKTQEASK